MESIFSGKQLIGTKLAEFCAHALLALEVLIHPRALPLADYSSTNHNSFGGAHCNFQDSYGLGQNKSSPFGLQQVGHDTPESDDDLCHRWLEYGKEPDVSLAEGTNTKHAEEPSGVSRDDDPKYLTVYHSSGNQNPETSKQASETATCTDIEMQVVEEDIVVKSDQPEESIVQLQEPISCKNLSVAEVSCGTVAAETVSERIVSDSAVPQHTDSQMESGQGVSTNKDGESPNLSNSLLPGTSGSSKDKGVALEFDHDDSSDEDAFPDIVDADPDSDSN